MLILQSQIFFAHLSNRKQPFPDLLFYWTIRVDRERIQITMLSQLHVFRVETFLGASQALNNFSKNFLAVLQHFQSSTYGSTSQFFFPEC